MHNHTFPKKSTIFIYIGIFLLTGPTVFAANLDNDLAAKKTPAIEILFTANLNGSIENCNCGNPPLGGLDYLATLIKRKRTVLYPVLFIDGGDFFNSYPYFELDETALQILDILQPDAFLPGEQEFLEDEKLIKRLFKITPVLGANFQYNGYPKNMVIVRDLPGNMKLFISGYLSPESFPERIPPKLAFSEESFKSIYDNLQKDNILVVVFHGTKQALDQFITNYPKTDLILWAHEQSRFVDISDNPAVVGGGSDGEHLILVDIFFDNKKEVRIQVERIPVSKRISSDTKVKKILENFNKKNEQ